MFSIVPYNTIYDPKSDTYRFSRMRPNEAFQIHTSEDKKYWQDKACKAGRNDSKAFRYREIEGGKYVVRIA